MSPSLNSQVIDKTSQEQKKPVDKLNNKISEQLVCLSGAAFPQLTDDRVLL